MFGYQIRREKKGNEGEGRGRRGVKKKSAPCLFKREEKGKERKMSVFLQIFSL